MQERRTTIRFDYPTRAQYCSGEELIPRDGWLQNLSERGASLWVHEAHHSGERITVTVPLKGTDDLMTATGLVRWSSQRPFGWRRHSVGVEWLALGETSRQCLQRFLEDGARAGTLLSLSREQGEALHIKGPRWLGFSLALAVIGAALMFLGLWVVAAAHRENRRLETIVRQRNAMMGRLVERDEILQQELGAANAQLAMTSREIIQLDQQTQLLEETLKRLNQDVGAVQRSYAETQQARRALAEQLMALERNRTELIRRLSQAEELQLAVREAIEARQGLQPATSSATPALPRTGSRGNRGFVVLNGRSTIPHPPHEVTKH